MGNELSGAWQRKQRRAEQWETAKQISNEKESCFRGVQSVPTAEG